MAFAPNSTGSYMMRMVRFSGSGKAFLLRAAIAAVAIGAFSGVAFAAWIENGSAMLMSLSASGLSWCL
ncbi:MAG: hypothetical protein M9939_18775 [Mesorhizobium sp.]|nr:hypothetical protein [Mesorhizobium sp.]MCO5163183.1 hypothetical protein [Mesorhizobium sp.]